jgi:hypothetical protein
MKIEELLPSIKLKHQVSGIKLNPPASLATIKQFENKIEFDLPTDFKEFYSICNGFECEEDIFNFLSLEDALVLDKDHGKNWVIFAEYMTYCDVWSLRKLAGDNYEIFYNDGQEITLTNSLTVFLEKFLQGNVFDEGGLYEWRDEVKKTYGLI